MQRPLFDPSKMARSADAARESAARRADVSAPPPAEPPGASAPARAEAPRPLTVSQLAGLLGDAVRSAAPAPVRVLGEVSNFSVKSHWYFSLKDEGAVIACVMFASATRRAAITPEHGAQVIAKGRLDYYAPSGRVSLIVDALEPVGEGALDAAYRKLVEEVRALGWLDPQRKRALPSFPSRIAVITSATGAALQDVLSTVQRRCPSVDVLTVDVRVQGEGSARDVTLALRDVSARARELRVDAVLLTRGGGSKEDLWTFNDREVARAIVECSVPVVAAIGHETDVTIAELVADERCSTPTQAAMRLTPDRAELSRHVASLAQRASHALRQRVRTAEQALRALVRSPALRDPDTWLSEHEERARQASENLAGAVTQRLQHERERVRDLTSQLEARSPQARLREAGARLEALRARCLRATTTLVRARDADLRSLERELHAVSPLRVLERGFSVTTDEHGRVLTDPGALRPGDLLRTRLAKGDVRSRVEGTLPQQQPASQPARPRPRPRRSTPQEGGLFG